MTASCRQQPRQPRPRAAPRALDPSADLYRGELVGLPAGIVRSCNPGIVGAEGTVVMETKNMLVLSARDPAGGGSGSSLPGMRRPYRSYPKAGSVWRFGTAAEQDAMQGRAEIDGSLIARRPEDRLRARPAARKAGCAQGGRRGKGGAGA